MDKNKECDNWLENEKSMRRFIHGKNFYEWVAITTTYVAIIFCAWMKFIDACTTSTLIGVVIGYHIKDIRKIHT